MNILIINDAGMKGGGTENRIRLLIGEFLRRNVFSNIHLMHHKTFTQNILDGVSIHEAGFGVISDIRLLRRVVSEHKIDIIQVHNMSALTPFLLAALAGRNIPVIFSAHDYWLICRRRRMVNSAGDNCGAASFKKCLKCSGFRTKARLWAYKKIINLFCRCGIAASDFIIKLHEDNGVLRKRWMIVKPWIDASLFGRGCSSILRKQDKIVFTGPLNEEKGAVVAAESMKFVVKQIPKCRLYFFGDGQERTSPVRKKIEIMADSDSLKENIVFGGERSWDELKTEYADAGVYIAPVIWNETFGLNWAEAMACGCPVIASAVGSLSELLSENAKLVPPKSPEKLAEAIIFVLKDACYASRVSVAGASYVNNNFNVSRAASDLLSLYKGVIKR